MTDLAQAHDRLRPLMFSIAYRMLGSVAEAEDVVQEGLLRIHQSAESGVVVESPDAFATTVTTRLAIDALRSARLRREQYVGSWLPEPLVTGVSGDPAGRVELDETISLAFLLLLERLTPVERAVFLLREVFGYGYDEIAAVIDKSAINCRQLMARARRRIADARPRFEPTPEQREELARRFFAAIEDGDLDGLERLLAADVVLYGDGGGKAPAIRQPLRGSSPVARFLFGLLRLTERYNMRVDLVWANGQPAAWVRDADGATIGVMSLEIGGGRIRSVQNQVNPDKLGHLGPVGDLGALLRVGGDR